MAIVEYKASEKGEAVTHATILRWLKPDGAFVKEGEAVAEVETDKATDEEYAKTTGVLSIKVPANTRVEIRKDVIYTIDPAGTPTAAAPAPGADTQPVPGTNSVPIPSAAPVPSAPTPQAEVRLSPAARPLVDFHRIDVSKLPANDRGVVTKGEVLSYLEDRSTQPPGPALTPPAPPPVPVRATPAPTGARETRQKMTPIRQRIAERLLSAQQNAAILTTFNEADLSAIMALRAKYKDSFQKKHSVGLGYMSFFVKASVEALKAFPMVNARIDGTDIVQQHFYDLGVAVSTDKGLMVPVVRNCDQLSFAEIEKGIGTLANKARDGKISVTDLQGGTFTITNGGIYGSMMSTPILNPPQSGILGMHAIQKRAVVVDDQVVVRPMMYLALSYDHRLIDGREAVGFLVRIKECLENPERLLLEV